MTETAERDTMTRDPNFYGDIIAKAGEDAVRAALWETEGVGIPRTVIDNNEIIAERESRLSLSAVAQDAGRAALRAAA